MKFSDAHRSLISACIERIERRTSAELVVVIEPSAGRYDVAHWLPATLAALVLLVFHLYSPWIVEPHFILLDVVLLFALSFAIVRFLRLGPRLVSVRRRTLELKRAAAHHFIAHRVHSTRDRTGILVYGALAENAFEVVVDEGVRAHIPPEAWETWMKDWKLVYAARETGPELVRHLEALGELLAEHLPARADDVDELPNAPVFSR